MKLTKYNSYLFLRHPVYGRGLEGCWRVYRDCLKDVLKVSTGYLGTDRVRTCQVRTGQVRSGQVRTRFVRTGQVKTGHVGTGHVRTGRVRTYRPNSICTWSLTLTLAQLVIVNLRLFAQLSQAISYILKP